MGCEVSLLRIDIAHFTCGKCGHRCTAPESVNAFGHEMEILEKIPIKVETDLVKGKVKTGMSQADRAKKKADLEKKHTGNSISIQMEGGHEVVRMARSNAKVAEQDSTALEDSTHVVLACPNCNATLYEWKAYKERVFMGPD